MDMLATFHGFGYEVFESSNANNTIPFIAVIDLQLQNERHKRRFKETEKRIAHGEAIRCKNNPIRLVLNAMDTLALFHGFGNEAVFMYTNSIYIILIIAMINLQLQNEKHERVLNK